MTHGVNLWMGQLSMSVKFSMSFIAVTGRHFYQGTGKLNCLWPAKIHYFVMSNISLP